MSPSEPYSLVLGIAQDAGVPQAGCRSACCAEIWEHPERHKMASALALVDPVSQERWLFEMTLDFKGQLRLLDRHAPTENAPGITGIFLTHGHIGHYTGLMLLGHEGMGTRDIPVFCMPRMQDFLTNNGPWNQLVAYRNIALQPLRDGSEVVLNERLSVTPMLVPHRNEYTETVGFLIRGPSRGLLFLPDIDKWERWEIPFEEVLEEVDVAYLDGTFYDDRELPDRDLSEIPHPFLVESMERFAPLPEKTREKIRFLHLNHSNPALRPESVERLRILKAGFGLAEQGEIVVL